MILKVTYDFLLIQPLLISSLRFNPLLIIAAPQLVAYGSFLNTDTTRVVSKRIVLSGHPFKVHKKIATIRYMFFNPGMFLFVLESYSLLIRPSRRHCLLQTHPTAYQTRQSRPHQGITWNTRLLQGLLRWPDQPNGHHLHVFIQACVSQMGAVIPWLGGSRSSEYQQRRRCGDGGLNYECIPIQKLAFGGLGRQSVYMMLLLSYHHHECSTWVSILSLSFVLPFPRVQTLDLFLSARDLGAVS